KRFIGQPDTDQQQAGSDYARHEVRADPRVAAFRRQHRRSGRDARAKREHAERERDFRGRAALHMRYFFRPSDSMIPATRLVSSSRNLPYASPARNTGVQPSFSSVAFHAGVSVAFLTSCTSASRCCSVIPGAPNMPRQLPSSTSIPCSFSEGMLSTLVGADCASARIFPAFTCSANSPIPETPALTCPPRIATLASPPPLNGT